MGNRQLAGVFSQIQQMAAGGCGPSDAQLLERFVAARDDAAFELLVRRHERLVFGVCRRMLPDFRDAEDAFQAVFLALARKARGIARREALAAWLYRVAFRTAATARAKWARDAVRLRPLTAASNKSAPIEPSQEISACLDEELRRLPERLRAPTILCYLEGRTVDEAARELGCPRGTVASRLARARARLRWRLTRRGLSVPSVAVAAVISAEVSAAETHALVGSAVRVVQWWNAGQGPARDGISARVIALSHEVLRAMSIKKLTNVAVLVIAAAGLLLIGGTLGLQRDTGAAEPDKSQQRKPAAEKPLTEKDAPSPARPLVSRPQLRDAAPFEEFRGRLEPALAIDVPARASGRLENINCKAGANVKKGQVLFEIESTIPKENLLKAEANLMVAEAKRRASETDTKRLRALAQNKAVSQEELDRALSTVEIDQASIQIARIDIERAKRELDATRVTAPCDGTVARIQINPGSHVVADKTILTTVVVLTPMQIVFDMSQLSFQRYQRLLKDGQVKKEGNPLTMGVGEEDGLPHKGMLASFDDRFDPDKNTIQVRGVVPNPAKDFLPGMYVRVRLQFGPPRHVLLLPEDALVSESNKFFVMVIKDNKVERRPVKLGWHNGDRQWVVEEGLDKDDWVVIEGAKSLRPGDRVEPRRANNPRRPE
jgi:RND family efflux transporter MFP subunit